MSIRNIFNSKILILIGAWLLISSMAFNFAILAQTQKTARQFSLKSSEIPKILFKKVTPEDWTSEEKGPIAGLKIFAREKAGAIWLGSAVGAVRFDPAAKHRWDRWQYFTGKRWLQDDQILNIYVDEAANERKTWIRTQQGVSLISWMPMTLAEKADFYEKMVEARHVRHGFVSDSHLKKPGDLATNMTTDSDNDGLWTAMYMAAQAYRYAVTGAPDARLKARRSLDAIIRLEEITGKSGFFARSIKSIDEPAPRGGEWHKTPDGKWLWKGDTSSDEAVGHTYGYALYYDLVADEPEKEAIRKTFSRIVDHLIDNNFNLVDIDGKPTRWGEWGTEFFKTEEGEYEKALRSAELLSMLKTAYHFTGNPKYEQVYRERIDHGYATNTLYYRRWISVFVEINFSDDELYYLSIFPLLLYEKDPALRDNYHANVRFTWEQIRPDMNPLWNFMSVALGAGEMTDEVLKESRMTLERIPLDLLNWGVKNSHRLDIAIVEDAERHGNEYGTPVLSPDERRMHKWNGNPYVLDDNGNGASEEAPTFYLLPYWMGRFYKWMKD